MQESNSIDKWAPEQLAYIDNHFKDFKDQLKDKGFLTKAEFCKVVMPVTNCTQEQMEQMFDETDEDGNGTISTDELQIFIEKQMREPPSKSIFSSIKSTISSFTSWMFGGKSETVEEQPKEVEVQKTNTNFFPFFFKFWPSSDDNQQPDPIFKVYDWKIDLQSKVQQSYGLITVEQQQKIARTNSAIRKVDELTFDMIAERRNKKDLSQYIGQFDNIKNLEDYDEALATLKDYISNFYIVQANADEEYIDLVMKQIVNCLDCIQNMNQRKLHNQGEILKKEEVKTEKEDSDNLQLKQKIEALEKENEQLRKSNHINCNLHFLKQKTLAFDKNSNLLAPIENNSLIRGNSFRASPVQNQSNLISSPNCPPSSVQSAQPSNQESMSVKLLKAAIAQKFKDMITQIKEVIPEQQEVEELKEDDTISQIQFKIKKEDSVCSQNSVVFDEKQLETFLTKEDPSINSDQYYKELVYFYQLRERQNAEKEVEISHDEVMMIINPNNGELYLVDVNSPKIKIIKQINLKNQLKKIQEAAIINCHAGIILLNDETSIVYEVTNKKKLSDFIRAVVGKVTFNIENTFDMRYKFLDGSEVSRRINLFKMKIDSQQNEEERQDELLSRFPKNENAYRGFMMEQSASSNSWFKCIVVIQDNKLQIFNHENPQYFNEEFTLGGKDGQTQASIYQARNDLWIIKLSKGSQIVKRFAFNDTEMVDIWKKYFQIV